MVNPRGARRTPYNLSLKNLKCLLKMRTNRNNLNINKNIKCIKKKMRVPESSCSVNLI
jgi:hypothetical protein